ncbi:FAD-dependent oxidoreductase [Mobiluncus mulieris]|uniref:FAD-dependent oxidoreductase n=1 Tax=Mobiluncus mulieris TaxID=2052 RepID=UPI00147022D7|nr:FAD-dependent oxidoreductase [Mobiluncus mulieris]
MARIVVIGAGTSGHATALGLRHRLDGEHQVIVISPDSLWVNPDCLPHIAAGLQASVHETVPLGSLYRRKGIIFHQALARVIYPQGLRDDSRPQVEIQFTGSPLSGEIARVPYDFLVVATGHDMNRVAGLPTEGATVASCVIDRLDSAIAGEAELRRLASEIQDSPLGDSPRVIAVGRAARGMGGYYGALEYALAVDGVLRAEGLRNRVQIHFFDAGRPWLYTLNEDPEMEQAARQAIEKLLHRYRIVLHRGKRLSNVNGNRLRYVSADGEGSPEEITCQLLAVEASRVLTPLEVKNPEGQDISGQLYDRWGRFKVDARLQENSRGEPEAVLPQTFRNPSFPRIFGIGSAIALDAVCPGKSVAKVVASGGTAALADLGTGSLGAISVDDSAESRLRDLAPEPSQTRDMSHLMSREVTDQIVGELTDEERKEPPERLDEIESVLSLEWDYTLFSRRGFYAEIGLTKSKENPRQVLLVRNGLFAYWSVRIERFLERYRAQGHPLWWLLPS